MANLKSRREIAATVNKQRSEGQGQRDRDSRDQAQQRREELLEKFRQTRYVCHREPVEEKIEAIDPETVED